MATSLPSYFAPTYFSPFYFPPLSSGVGPSGPPIAVYRDGDVFTSLAAALASTGEFADVFFGPVQGMNAAGANRTPAAVIVPEGWSEADEVDPVELVRRVTFTITIIARDEDALARYQTLDRLSSVAQNAIDGSNLGGTCLPALTKLGRGVFDARPDHPEQSVALSGEVTYLVPSLTGHNTAYPY
jgi:hypothetical protein